jgi:plasmid maintenance system antidote protein VapI
MEMRSWWITRITTEEYEMSRMHNPPHPGLTLRDDVLPALGINVTDAAQALGMQAAYDLWAAEQKTKKVICKIKPLSAAALAVA